MMLSLRSLRTATTLLALISLAACSSSKKEDPTPPAQEISWTADGVALKTTTTQSQKRFGTIGVAGTTPTSPAATFISLQFPDAVGTYPFSSTAEAAASYTASTGTVYYAGASGTGTVTGAGTIVVTERTATNVTGTFTFTVINSTTGDSKSLTNGKFNVGL
jgi:hypothetical protein